MITLPKPKRSLTAQALRRLFTRPRNRSQSLIPSLRNKRNQQQPVENAIVSATSAALRIGSASIPPEEKRMETLNIDTDDEDDNVPDANGECSTIDEEIGASGDDDDFNEITETLGSHKSPRRDPNSSAYVPHLK